jgi:hypothetical protein
MNMASDTYHLDWSGGCSNIGWFENCLVNKSDEWILVKWDQNRQLLIESSDSASKSSSWNANVGVSDAAGNSASVGGGASKASASSRARKYKY